MIKYIKKTLLYINRYKKAKRQKDEVNLYEHSRMFIAYTVIQRKMQLHNYVKNTFTLFIS